MLTSVVDPDQDPDAEQKQNAMNCGPVIFWLS
jgi:hypothetical protein